ncbi:MAG: hypothetical protein V3W37_07265, partial [Candidatus Binatia bacterium]
MREIINGTTTTSPFTNLAKHRPPLVLTNLFEERTHSVLLFLASPARTSTSCGHFPGKPVCQGNTKVN